MVDCNPAPLKNSRRHLLYVLRILLDFFMQKETKMGPSRLILHIICGSKQVLTKGNEKILLFIQWLQDFINKDPSASNNIRVAYLPRISNHLYEKLVAATDIVTMTHIPGSVSSDLEVIPFLMNGAVLCSSGKSNET
jgi:hypothetical protein